MTEQIKTVQYLGQQIKHLEELYSLKSPDRTMLECIQDAIEKPLYQQYLSLFKRTFPTQLEVKSIFEALEEKIFKQDMNVNQFQGDLSGKVQSIAKELEKFLHYEIYKEDVESFHRDFASKVECNAIREEFDNLPKLD